MNSWHRNATDARLRELEREALATGDPAVAYQAYVERRRAGIEPHEYVGFGEQIFESRHGPIRIALTEAGHVHVENRWYLGPGGTRQENPFFVNRVPILFSAHLYRFPDGSWRPYHPTREEDRWRRERDRGEYYTSRSDRPYEVRSTISDAAQKKLDRMVREAVNGWAQSQAGEVFSAAELGEVSRRIHSLEGDLEKLMGQVEEVRLKIGEAYLRELRVRGGQL